MSGLGTDLSFNSIFFMREGYIFLFTLHYKHDVGGFIAENRRIEKIGMITPALF